MKDKYKSEEEKLKVKILECKTCNVTEEDLFTFPIGSKDSFKFDNFCLNHKIDFVELVTKVTVKREFIGIIQEMIRKQEVEFEDCKLNRTTRMRNTNSKNWGMVNAENRIEHYQEVLNNLNALVEKENEK